MKYQVTIKTLTPLHIGTGTELLKDYDYVSSENKTYILNQDAIFEDKFREGKIHEFNIPAGRLVSIDQLSTHSHYVRYVLNGRTTINEIQEQIKNCEDGCYIPGSSLKGAIRTAILNYGRLTDSMDNDLVKYEQDKNGRYNEKKADDRYEAACFRPGGDDANRDFMRILQVSDSQPLNSDPTPLRLFTARVFTGKQSGSPIVVEAIREGISFTTEINIDESIIKNVRYVEKLGWSNRISWLVNLIPVFRGIGISRLDMEKRAAESRGFNSAAKFYDETIKRAQLSGLTNTVIFQMGWGTGWTGMTIGPSLSIETQHQVRERFKLGSPPSSNSDWKPDLTKPFPQSRRLQSIGNDTPGLPFGWVEATFDEISPESETWKRLKKDSQPYRSPTNKMLLQEEIQMPQHLIPKHRSIQPPPTPRPRHEKAAPETPIIKTFENLPKVGDRFEGVVIFTDDNGIIYLEIPGLSADDLAMALLSPKDNINLPKMKEKKRQLCKVLAVEEDKQDKGHWLVRCQLAE